MGTTALFAQSPDKMSLGNFSVPGFPYVPMQDNSKSFSIVKDHKPIKGFSADGYIPQSLYLRPSWMTYTQQPDGADIVISVNDLFSEVYATKFYQASEKKPKLKGKEVKQTAKDVIAKMGKLSVSLGNSTQSSIPFAPIPSLGMPKAGSIARAEKYMGFNIEARTGEGVVFSDTVTINQEFESDIQMDITYANDLVVEKTKSLTLPNEMRAYTPFLFKALGMSPLEEVKFHIYKIKANKKSPHDYSDINQAAESFKQGFEVIKKRQIELDPFDKIATPAVQLWKNNLDQADLNNNNAKINKEVAAALYYNLGVYYAIMKDYEQAFEYFKKSKAAMPELEDIDEITESASSWASAQREYKRMMESNK